MSKNKMAVISFIGAYILSRLIFYFLDFRYDIFQDGFNVKRFLVDFGVWGIIYGSIYWILNLYFKEKK